MTDPRNLEAVRALLQRRRHELIGQYQAAGVGIGRENDVYVIVVYLKSARQRPAEGRDLEGVPLKFEVTGRFTTQSA